MEINGSEKFKYDSNSFVILPPYSRVKLEIEEKTKALVIEIDSYLINHVLSKLKIEFEPYELGNVNNVLFVGKYSPDLTQTYKKIVDTFFSRKVNREFLLDLYTQEFVYDIFKYRGAEKIINDKNSEIYHILDYINTNYLRKLKISDIAKEFSMKEYELTKYFKKFTGKSPKEYIKDLKLNKAKELLKFENVTNVCYDIRYENISHFIKEFKNKFGVTPNLYKKTLNS
ncbi:helix-turn-helix domain-containing protein [Caldicellulosiruptor sp. DIB 104C]|uniref:helix-turn-helix domain-containing protein n=1 Tax=Caldicellulosiruptor sp. DIB 104C TaxID=3019889 RepID=UPI0023054715|nr:AraC family transcriptional regulator [Caldicellulosiruptor sp. DIB 104C]